MGTATRRDGKAPATLRDRKRVLTTAAVRRGVLVYKARLTRGRHLFRADYHGSPTVSPGKAKKKYVVR